MSLYRPPAARAQRMERRNAAFFAAMCLVLSACEGPRPVRLGTDTHFYGYIADGAKRGVSVGDDLEAAAATLGRDEYESTGSVDCRDAMARLWRTIDCNAGATIEIFQRHNGLGHDWVYLEFKDKTVVRIGWQSVLFQIDF